MHVRFASLCAGVSGREGHKDDRTNEDACVPPGNASLLFCGKKMVTSKDSSDEDRKMPAINILGHRKKKKKLIQHMIQPER